MTAEEEINKKLGLPKVLEVCPHCGSQETYDMELIHELERLNKIPEKLFTNGCVLSVPFFNRASVKLIVTDFAEVPTLNIYFHICKNCFTIYPHNIQFNLRRIPLPKMNVPE